MVETKLLSKGFISHQHYRFTITLLPTHRSNQSRKLLPIKGQEAIAA